MPWAQAPFHDYPGLDLVSSPDNSSCVDNLNVYFDKRGAVRSRGGFTTLGSALTAAAFAKIWTWPRRGTSATDIIFVNGGTRMEAVSSTGTVLASATSLSGGQATFAPFGTPAASSVYAGNGFDTLQKFAPPSTWSAPTATVDGVGAQAMPKARYLAVQRADNRLVAAWTGSSGGPDGATSSASHVWFSDAGDAESWTTTNYVILTPGDGEEIRAVCSWRDLVFVFKETRFFVFYGNSVDGTGLPVFNYHVVDAKAGCNGVNTVAVAPHGVYFADFNGVYLTTGGEPTEVSAAIRPIFQDASATAFFQGSTAWPVARMTDLCWHRNRLYLTYSTNGSFDRAMLVYDHTVDAWAYHDYGWLASEPYLTSAWVGSPESLELVIGHGTQLYRHGEQATDNGTAITSRYRSGFYDLGSDEDKRIAQAAMWGTGTVRYSLSRDFKALDDGVGPAADVALGTSPAVARGKAGVGGSGTLFSHQLASVSGGAWLVHRLQHEIAGTQAAGTKR